MSCALRVHCRDTDTTRPLVHPPNLVTNVQTCEGMALVGASHLELRVAGPLQRHGHEAVLLAALGHHGGLHAVAAQLAGLEGKGIMNTLTVDSYRIEYILEVYCGPAVKMETTGA